MQTNLPTDLLRAFGTVIDLGRVYFRSAGLGADAIGEQPAVAAAGGTDRPTPAARADPVDRCRPHPGPAGLANAALE